MSQFIVLSGDYVTVKITGSASDFTSERRFPKSMTIFELKSKLELVTGCACATMTLELYDAEDKLVCSLANNDAMLGSYPVDDGMRIHANDPASKGAFDFAAAGASADGKPLYTMSDEEYRNKGDTFLQFKRANKLGEFAEVDPEVEQKQREAEAEEKTQAEAITVGSRCEVSVPGQASRRGEVAFVGKADFKPGWWIGVRLDEPLGKNDGSVAGKRYFQCAPKYGGFFKAKDITVGDFPELGIDELDEI